MRKLQVHGLKYDNIGFYRYKNQHMHIYNKKNSTIKSI